MSDEVKYSPPKELSKINYLTPKQQRYIENRLKGMSKRQALINAGYTENASSSRLDNQKATKEAWNLCMLKSGVTEERLAKKISEGLESTKVFMSTFKGKIVDRAEVPDNESRYKFVRMSLESKGLLNNDRESIDVNVGIVNMPYQAESENAWNENA